jgi:hypothetical protein
MILTSTEQEHSVTLTQKEFNTLADILLTYKQFEEELYDYPPIENLFTATQLRLFEYFIPEEMK